MSTNDNAPALIAKLIAVLQRELRTMCTKRATEPAAMPPSFEGHYHNRLADLPKQLREWVERDPRLHPTWDALSEDTRKRAIARRGLGANPELAFQATFNQFCEAAALVGLTALDAAGHLLVRDGELLVRLGAPCIEVDALPLAKKLLTLDELRTSGVDTIHPLAEWLRRAKERGIEYLPGLDWAVEHCGSADKNETARVEEEGTPRPCGELEHWKMKVQAEATARWRAQRKRGCNPTRHSLKDELAKWCRDNGIRTTSGINPNADYLYRHVLSKRNWKPPADDSAN